MLEGPVMLDVPDETKDPGKESHVYVNTNWEQL